MRGCRPFGRALAAVSIAVLAAALAGCGQHPRNDPGASRSDAQAEMLRERALSQQDR